MKEKERKARENKQNGYNCSNSIYKVFEEEYHLDGNIPQPRSIDGKCGAVLTTEKILKELGKEEKIDSFEEYFLKEFGSLKCLELMKKERRCMDYVGQSTAYLCDKIENQERI